MHYVVGDKEIAKARMLCFALDNLFKPVDKELLERYRVHFPGAELTTREESGHHYTEEEWALPAGIELYPSDKVVYWIKFENEPREEVEVFPSGKIMVSDDFDPECPNPQY